MRVDVGPFSSKLSKASMDARFSLAGSYASIYERQFAAAGVQLFLEHCIFIYRMLTGNIVNNDRDRRVPDITGYQRAEPLLPRCVPQL